MSFAGPAIAGEDAQAWVIGREVHLGTEDTASANTSNLAEVFRLVEEERYAQAKLALPVAAAWPDDARAIELWIDIVTGEASPLRGLAPTIHPKDPHALLLFARVLLAIGLPEQAAEVASRLLRVDSVRASAAAAFASGLQALGRSDQACSILRDALRRESSSGELRLRLALVLSERGQHQAALMQCRAALVLDPAGSRVLRQVANLMRRLRRSSESLVVSAWLLCVRPDDNRARNLYAAALIGAHSYLRAAAVAREGLQLPSFADEAAGLACAALLRGGSPDAALKVAQEWAGLDRRPSPARLLSTLGQHVDVTDKRAFVHTLVSALDAEPGLLEKFGDALLAEGDVKGFSLALDRCISGASQDLRTLTKLLDVALRVCDFDDVERWTGNLRDFLDTRLDGMTTLRGVLHASYLAPFVGLEIGYCRRLSETIARLLPPAQPLPTRLSGQRPIRVGYASPHFGDHPIGHATCRLFENHDRSVVEVFAFSLADRFSDHSDHAAIIRAGVDRFVSLEGRSDDDAAAAIRSHGIDILVDLNGFMTPSRLSMFARRPAPVQCYWLGHGGGLGVGAHDYLIADHVVVPDAHAALYRERVVRLPDVFAPADRPRVPEFAGTRAQYGLAETGVVFCAFNNPQKLDRRTIEAWLRIIASVPGSQLWLTGGGFKQALADRLRAMAKARGIDGRRLVFADRVPSKSEHLARHRLADLFLDSLHHNAATTALDALWAGLPILTVAGDQFLSRVGASMLHAVGMDELVCPDEDSLVARAIALVTCPGELATVRRTLERRLDSAPLFDTPRFARHLEMAFSQMLTADPADRTPIDVAPLVVATCGR